MSHSRHESGLSGLSSGMRRHQETSDQGTHSAGHSMSDTLTHPKPDTPTHPKPDTPTQTQSRHEAAPAQCKP
eukprot:47975-Chlamydomonas_euryale.AAC.2